MIDFMILSQHDRTEAEGLVSIVIPTTNLDYLEACLGSIEADRASYPSFEIILVNDGSTDPDFLSFLRHTDHRVVNTGENVGFARANNAGFRVAHGEYMMTLNADTIVHPGWLKNLVYPLSQDASIGAVGPTVLEWRSETIQSAGSDWHTCSYRKFKAKYHGRSWSSCQEVHRAYRVDGLIGVCVLFRRSALFEAGLFDERFLNGWEDMDLSLSLVAKGYALYHAPALIEHKGSFIRKNYTPDYYRTLVQQNRKRFMAKWGFITVQDHCIVRDHRMATLLASCNDGYHALRCQIRDVAHLVSSMLVPHAYKSSS